MHFPNGLKRNNEVSVHQNPKKLAITLGKDTNYVALKTQISGKDNAGIVFQALRLSVRTHTFPQ
jgi:hypothetical protein